MRLVGRMVGDPFFFKRQMSSFLYENHWGSPTLTLLNVLGVLGVLNVLNVLNVLYVLYVLYVLNVLHVLHGRIVGLLGLVSGNPSWEYFPGHRGDFEFCPGCRDIGPYLAF